MKNKTFLLIIPILVSIFSTPYFSVAQTSNPTLTLNTNKTSAINGEAIPVTIKMTTDGNKIVVARAVIRYNKSLVNVDTSDVSLTNSVFATNNTCLFPNDYSDVALRNQPCQIIENDATYGILSITLAMPSSTATTNPGAEINGNDLLVATVNFHAIANVSDSLTAINLQYTASGNYTDSDVIIDDGSGTDVLITASPRSGSYKGDLNNDHTINILDYGILHTNYQNSSCSNAADVNGDCTVNILDYGSLHANYGTSV